MNVWLKGITNGNATDGMKEAWLSAFSLNQTFLLEEADEALLPALPERKSNWPPPLPAFFL